MTDLFFPWTSIFSFGNRELPSEKYVMLAIEPSPKIIVSET